MKQRWLCGLCMLVLISLVGCDREDELISMESQFALVAESDSKSGDLTEEKEMSTAVDENSQNETTEFIPEQEDNESVLQHNTERTTEESTVADLENGYNEVTEFVPKQEDNESILQHNSERTTENESTVADIGNTHNETTETMGENASQMPCTATVEKQMYLSEEQNMSMNIADVEGLCIFLNSLSFSSETCDGLPEYSIFFDDGSGYYVNLTEGWIWRDKKEAKLTSEEIVFLKDFIQ